MNARPTSEISGTSDVCGGTVSIALTGTPPWSLVYYEGTTTASVFESGIVSSPFTFSSSPPSGSYTYTVTSLSDAYCTSTSGDRTGSAVITANTPPTITTQPSTSVNEYCPGDTPNDLSITADAGGGTIVSYEWYSNDTNVNSGGTLVQTTMTSSTTDSYTPSTVSPGTLYYYCVVTTSGPSCTVTSDVSGSVIVDGSPSISAHPSTTVQNVCKDDVATTLFVTATGSNLIYEWYKSTDAANNTSGDDAVVYGPSTSSSFTPPTNVVGTLYYYSIVYGSCLPEATSNVSGAIMTNSLPTISAQPSTTARIACEGVAYPFTPLSVTASGTGLTYQWYSNTTQSNSGGTAISGETGLSLTPSTSTAGTLYFYCVVTSSSGCSVTSNASGSITVPLVIITQPVATQTLVVGSSVSFTVAASPGSTFRWRKDGVNLNNGGTISGVTTATLTIVPVASSDAGTYTVVVSRSACSVSVTSNNSYLVSEQPTTQASAIIFSSITSSSLTLTWTNGDGSNRIVVGRSGASVDQLPADAVSYTAAATIGSGGIEIANGTDNYVVYNGSGNSVTVTGLSTSVNYYFRVFEYSGSGTTSSYLTSTASGNPNNQSTRPSVQATGFTFSNVSPTGMTLDWTTNGDGTNRIVVARNGGAPTSNGGDPTDGVVYTANSTFGSGTQIGSGNYVVYSGTGSSATISGLTASNTYYYNVYEFSGANAAASNTNTTVYLTSPSPATSSQATPTASGPTTQASNIVFTAITSSSLTLTWTSGNGQNRMVLGRASAAVNSDPVDGTTYLANSTFGSGTQIGSGNYTVFNGSGNTVTITGLSPSVTYYFKVYEYNNAGSASLYSTFSATNNPNYQSTRPDVQAYDLNFPSDEVLSDQVTLNWINGNGTSRLVLAHENAAVNATPTDGNIYTASSTFQSGQQIGTGNYVVYNGTGSSVIVTGLEDGTDYFFQVFEYSGVNASASSTTDLTEYLTSTATANPAVVLTPARFAYRSRASGDWSNLAIWQTFDVKTGLWKDATKLPKKNNNITISTGDLVTLNDIETSDQIVINGTLTIGSSGNLTVDFNTKQAYNLSIGGSGKLNVYGILSLANKAISIGHSTSNTHFYSTSTYEHLYKTAEGIIPLATWDAGSTITIGYTGSITATSAGNWNQSFSNVTFDCSLGGTSSIDMNGLLTSVGGNLTVNNTGTSGQVILNGGTSSPTITISGNVVVTPTSNSSALVLNNSTGSPTINIGGNATVSGSSILTLNKTGSPAIKVGNSGSGSISVSNGGRLIVNTSGSPTLTIPNDLSINSTNATGSALSGSGSPIINVDGSLSMSGSGGLLLFGSGTAVGTATLNLKKDFTLTSGTITNTSSNTSNAGQVNFMGGSTATQYFSNAGTLSGKIHFTLSTSSTLDVGTSAITGSGDFAMASTATLRVGSIDPIGAMQFGSTGGNLRNTGARTFAFVNNSSAATIEYNGTAAQLIGDGFPVSDASNRANLTISNTVGVTPPATLTLGGHLTNNGAFIHNSGTVVFAANTNKKEIRGTVKITFNNLTVNGSSANPDLHLENSAGADIIGILDLTTSANSVFDADGIADNRILTLLSSGDNPTVDASVAKLSTTGTDGANKLLGNVTVQRHMSLEGGSNSPTYDNDRIYRYISSPVQNATVADIQNEIPVTGSFTGRSTCTTCVGPQSMFSYNEAAAGNLQNGYVDFPDAINTETLVPGVGYAIFVRGDILSTARWDVRGPINAGPVTLPVSYTVTTGLIANDGWNLVGNPFPATIDWDAATGWTKVGLNGSIYYRDNGSGTSGGRFATYNSGIGLNGGSKNIAMGQAFWVKAISASPSLIIDERAKASGTQTTFFREAAPKNILRITLANDKISDESVIYFNEGSTPGFDGWADAYKLKNTALNLSSVIQSGDKLAINSMPAYDCNYDTKLAVEDVVPGNYSLSFSEFESFPDEVSIKVRDNFTNSEFDVRSQSSYPFTVTADVSSYGANRFSVFFAAPQVNTEFDVSTTDICMGNDAVLTIAGSSTGVRYEAIADGTILSTALGNGLDISLTVPNAKLITGQNTINVKSTSTYCSVTTSERTVTLTVEGIPASASVESGKHCRDGVITLNASGSLTGNYNWYENQHEMLPIPDQHSSTLVTPSLSSSRYYFVSLVNSLGCEGPRTPVLAEVIHYNDVTISVQKRDLISSFTQGNQWYFNDQPIGGAIYQTHKATRSGIYSVEVDISGCSTAAQIYFPVAIGMKFEDEIGFTAYPNPVTATLTLSLPNPEGYEVTINMMDATGRSVILRNTVPSDDDLYEIDTALLPSGLYILHVKVGAYAKTMKVMKE